MHRLDPSVMNKRLALSQNVERLSRVVFEPSKHPAGDDVVAQLVNENQVLATDMVLLAVALGLILDRTE